MRTIRRWLPAVVVLALSACGQGDGGDVPKHSVKEIMVLAHKKGLVKKAILGTATAGEKHELTDLYVDLAKNSVSKGSAESWKEKTTALVQAAKDVEAGKPLSGAALRKAVDCDTCHNAHK